MLKLDKVTKDYFDRIIKESWAPVVQIYCTGNLEDFRDGKFSMDVLIDTEGKGGSDKLTKIENGWILYVTENFLPDDGELHSLLSISYLRRLPQRDKEWWKDYYSRNGYELVYDLNGGGYIGQ